MRHREEDSQTDVDVFGAVAYASIMHSEQRRHRSWFLFTLLQTNGWIGKPIPRYRLHVYSCAKLHVYLI